MKKILSIVATAALFSTVASTAHADTVNFPGTVTASCTLSTPVNGALTEGTAPATTLTTEAGNEATVVATCNGSGSLGLAAGTHSLQTNDEVVAYQFAGGDGIFAAATGATASLANPTTAVGDTAKISASVTAATGKLLKKGSYTVVVNATITP